MMHHVVIVGIAGGSGSGKSTLARRLKRRCADDAILIEEDFYYQDRSHIPFEERGNFNFDHPESVDFVLMLEQLTALKKGQVIEAPCYNFCTHAREPEVQEFRPARVVLVEGILLFTMDAMREIFDMKLFLDVPADLRLLRRIMRDVKERGRSLDNIRDQYVSTVRPMYEEFVEPTRDYADIVISGDWNIEETVNFVLSELKIL